MTSQHPQGVSEVGLQRVAPLFRDSLRRFSKRLEALFGARLLGWTIYGPAASGGHPTPDRRAQHVLMLDRIDLALLAELAPEGQVFGPLGLAAPLIMTPAYVQTSLDSFPLEFIEIHQRHVTLWGSDFFAEIESRDADIRLGCEREVKVLLLGMRQGLLSVGVDPSRLVDVERNVILAVERLLVGMTWLKGHREYQSPETRLDAIETTGEHRLPAIRAALASKDRCPWEDFCRLYDDLETLRKIIDAW